MMPSKILTGIDVVDDSWGGLVRGSSYLLYGTAPSGRALLALQIVRTAAARGEHCVLLTSSPPELLSAQAAQIGFDLDLVLARRAVEMRPISQEMDRDLTDDQLEAAMEVLCCDIREAAPNILVAESFSPYVRFLRFAPLRRSIDRLLAAISASRTAAVLTLGEPANERSRDVVSFLRSRVAGGVHIGIDPLARRTTSRHLTLLPALSDRKPHQEWEWDISRLDGLLVRSAHAQVHDDASRQARAGFAVPASSGDGALVPMPATLSRLATSTVHAPAIPAGAVAADVLAESFPVAEQPAPDPAPIRFFDPRDPHGPPPDATDPFGSLEPHSLFQAGHYVEGRFEGDSAAGEAAPLAGPVSGPPGREPRGVGRSEFAAAFASARTALESDEVPFVAIGFRAPALPPAQAAQLFGVAEESLAARGVLYADQERARLAVLLPEHDEDGARAFFSDVARRVRNQGSEELQAALRGVSAAVSPNGVPFATGEDFLAFAIDDQASR